MLVTSPSSYLLGLVCFVAVSKANHVVLWVVFRLRDASDAKIPQADHTRILVMLRLKVRLVWAQVGGVGHISGAHLPRWPWTHA